MAIGACKLLVRCIIQGHGRSVELWGVGGRRVLLLGMCKARFRGDVMGGMGRHVWVGHGMPCCAPVWGGCMGRVLTLRRGVCMHCRYCLGKGVYRLVCMLFHMHSTGALVQTILLLYKCPLGHYY